MPSTTILIVDDEQLIRWAVSERLREAGHTVLEAETGKQALARSRESELDLIVLDQGLPDAKGTELIAQLKERDPDAPIIMMTADARVETAVAAMRAGAYHYLNKPVNLDELQLLVEKALEATRLKREVRSLKAGQAAPYSFDHIIGESKPMRQVKQLLGKIARSPGSTVLITGESGTGKDLAAKAVHYNSDRAEKPFMNITCSALPENLLESELFGHERGAFTDAKQTKKGLLEQADGGTVFLDEIGEMSPSLQAKLLRFLEEKAFRRVGGAADIRPDVRVIAATNRDLQQAVKDGTFREDLYYRLNVLHTALPPLRERVGDIPLLVEYYVGRFCGEFGKNACTVSDGALKLLESYAWPGNVRELRNVVERAVLLAETAVLEAEDFQGLPADNQLRKDFRLPLEGIDFDRLERDLVQQALDRAGGNQTKAAELLGMNRDQIRYRMDKFDLKSEKRGTGKE